MAVERDASASLGDKARDRLDARGLAGAVGAKQRDRAAGLERQIEALEPDHGPARDAQRGDVEDHAAASPSPK